VEDSDSVAEVDTDLTPDPPTPPADTDPQGGDDTPDPPPGDVDDDADGFVADDCDDDDETTYPGAPERCDGRDNDCDGAIPGEEIVDGAPACQTCSDAGFWDAVRDATDGADLWTRLATAASTNGACDYGDSTTFMFVTLDKVAGEVECVYTGARVAVGQVKPAGEVMNTEHTWPQSLGGGVGERVCDLHHLFPTTSMSNSRRGNYPLAPVVGGVDWQEGGSRLGDDASGATVFEPRDVHKGNAARALLYMHLRYGLALTDAEWTRYRAWHDADPPDARDQARNLGILGWQGNANPFVACPQTVHDVVVPRP
jgi:hypothetical protein